MRSGNRRTATRVRDGRVQKKNNWTRDQGDYFSRDQRDIRLDRSDPGPGFRHLVTIAQLREFVALLPDWDEIAVGLDAIVLAEGESHAMGWHTYGVVGVCAWEHGIWWDDCYPGFIRDHAELLDTLGVVPEKSAGRYRLRWTEEQARAFQLLHILPHELGHHHDRITTRAKRLAARGEPYAEAYAYRVMDAVFPAYLERFGL